MPLLLAVLCFLAIVKSFAHVSDNERRLVTNMSKEGISWAKMMEITGRCKQTLTNILRPAEGKNKATKEGAPKKLPPQTLAKVMRSMEKLQKKKHPKARRYQQRWRLLMRM